MIHFKNKYIIMFGEEAASAWASFQGGREQGGKSPFSLLSEPISPSSLLFWANFSLLPTFSAYFSLRPTFFGPFLPPPYSVPPPSFHDGPLPWSNWNLEMLVFVEEGKPKNPEKNPWHKVRTNNKLNTHMTPGRNRTQATSTTGGERCHRRFIAA